MDTSRFFKEDGVLDVNEVKRYLNDLQLAVELAIEEAPRKLVSWPVNLDRIIPYARMGVECDGTLSPEVLLAGLSPWHDSFLVYVSEELKARGFDDIEVRRD